MSNKQSNWQHTLYMSAQCYEHRFGYCTIVKTCFNVHFRPILAKRRVLLSLRWSSYVAPKSPKWDSKMQNSRFPSKIALRLNKVCYEVSLCENCQRQSCRAFICLTIHAKIIGGGRPLLPEFLGQTDRDGAKSPIFDVFFARSPSTVTPSEKSSINTNRKSITRFPMSQRWTSYVVPKSRRKGAFSKTQKLR